MDVDDEGRARRKPRLDLHLLLAALPVLALLQMLAFTLVLMHGSQILQNLQNLLGNAVKFGPEGGTLRLKLETAGSSAPISVGDDGIGIDPTRQGDISTPFSQIDPGIDRSNGGLGLGLSTSLQLATMHGGTLSAHRDGLGQGTVFTLALPLQGVGPCGAG